MAYTSYQSYISNVAATPKADWTDDFQQFVTEEFYNSSSWFTIQEETSFASGSYQNVDVRINYVFNPTTGQNMGDDWKLLMFPTITKQVDYGAMFLFDNNYWVTVNVENKKNLTSTCIVRRCNNTLRWQDESGGGIYMVPCVLDYVIQENRNYASAQSAIVNPSGILNIISQLNSKSNKIVANQRFLFGNADNWTAYKIFGGGINNFNNLQTLTNSSTGILKLTAGVDFVNDQTDDLVNGICDINENVYTIDVTGSLNGQEGTTSQLTASVYLNGLSVTRDITWSSDDTDIATTSSSGLVTFVAEGTANITATLTDNANVYDTVGVETLLVPALDYVVSVSPSKNYVLEGDTDIFTVNLYLDGVLQVDTFVFTVVPNTVPSSNYTYALIDGNNFSIKNNEMFLTDTLNIQCVSGIHSKTIEFNLLGGW